MSDVVRKISSIQIIDKLNPVYGCSNFCSLLYDEKCRYNLVQPSIKKCDECYLFHSKEAIRYQNILNRYKKGDYKNEN